MSPKDSSKYDDSCKKGNGILRSGHFSSGVQAFMAKLKLKWSDYRTEILQPIVQEEIRISRAEHYKQIEGDELGGQLPKQTGQIAPE